MNGETLVARLSAHGHRIAVAESCTGGCLAAEITSVPGSSKVFAGGIVSYDDASKQDLLGVTADQLAQFGAVSGAVVEAMAHGVRERFHCDVAVAISGIAGPAGGTREKPVGTVWIAALGPNHLIDVHRVHFDGDRSEVRAQAVAEAIAMAVDVAGEADIEAE